MTETDHGQRELSNMLVKKNALIAINNEGTFTQGFKDCRKKSKLKFIILTFNVTFINKSHGDIKRRCII